MKHDDANPKVVVITGASSGFGKGIALKLAESRIHIVVAARRIDLLDDLVNECKSLKSDAIAVCADVSDPLDVQQLHDCAIGEFGRIDVWINNAGVGALGLFDRVPIEEHAKVIETNLLGTLYGSHLAYRTFLEQNYGTLINVSSEYGKVTAPYYSAYVASKHGIVGLTNSIRQEVNVLKLNDIHICLVLPTAHDTPFFDHMANHSGHEVRAPEPLHDPADVVDVLYQIIENPRDEKIVGSDGVVYMFMKTVAPSVLESMSAKQTHKGIENAPPAEDTHGSVLAPVEKGVEIQAGRRAASS